jgi:hypothetical protein
MHVIATVIREAISHLMDDSHRGVNTNYAEIAFPIRGSQ